VEEGYTQFSVPQVMTHAWLADISYRDAYWNNVNAESEAAAATGSATSAATLGGSFMSMDDDDDDGGGGGDPCSLTNLLQSFSITSVTHSTNGTTITWQSCQLFRYLVFSVNVLSTNTSWTPRAYVWGQTNSSSTTWTDAATTNNDGSTVTQRFYRVQRLLGSPIAAGGESSVALRPDGSLWAWGSNDGGELGDGLGGVQGADGNFVELYLPYPGEVANVLPCVGQAISNAVAVAAGGDDYTVIVDATGTVWTFGENDSGQLGAGESEPAGNDTSYPVPAPVSGVGNVVSVAAGYRHTLALCANATVWAWGFDDFGAAEDNDNGASGALGAGYDVDSTNSPIQSLVPTGTNIVAIAAGNGFSLALDTSGRVWGWGDNQYGEIGNGVASGVGLNGTNTPILVQGISDVIAIAAGGSFLISDPNTPEPNTGGGHSIALTSDKRVWTFGDNAFGELGRNTGTLTYDPSPQPVAGLSNVVAIAGGVGFTLAVTSNGQVYAWGDNTFGELGTNTSAVASNNTPMLVAGVSNAVWVSAARTDDGIISMNFTYNGHTYYYAGGVHAMAMTLDPVDGSSQMTNHYWSWGDNSYGQVGNVTNGGATNLISQYTPAGPLQFCTRCQRTVQLGTNGSFTAQCNGTLYLYFNTDNHSRASNGTNSYSATVIGLATNVAVSGINTNGVAVGSVTNGGIYTYSASGFCQYNIAGNLVDPNGNPPSGSPPDCSSFSVIDITNAACPIATCFSLVGKIQ